MVVMGGSGLMGEWVCGVSREHPSQVLSFSRSFSSVFGHGPYIGAHVGWSSVIYGGKTALASRELTLIAEVRYQGGCQG